MTGSPRPNDRSSARRPTPTSGDGFALTGPADPPDPRHHAFRKDLADVALAGRVIASHYAEPLSRVLGRSEPLRATPDADSEIIRELGSGDPFEMLDNSLGWAWGYGGSERLVGYVRSDALA